MNLENSAASLLFRPQNHEMTRAGSCGRHHLRHSCSWTPAHGDRSWRQLGFSGCSVAQESRAPTARAVAAFGRWCESEIWIGGLWVPHINYYTYSRVNLCMSQPSFSLASNARAEVNLTLFEPRTNCLNTAQRQFMQLALLNPNLGYLS